MSRIITSLLISMLAMSTFVNGQIRTPAASPSASFTQDVGLTQISVEYSRPGVKGREIFSDNGLVPFGKVWRTGANSATKITFSTPVIVEGKSLKEGSYAILTMPGATSWNVHFYDYEGGNWGSYVDKDPAAIVTVAPKMIPWNVENFSISVGDITDNSGVLELAWASTLVPVKIETEVDKAVMASIEKVLAGPTPADYYAAGTYYYNSGKDLNKALEYIQKATKGDSPRYWQLRMESEVLAKLGRYKEAIAVAEKSKTLAMEAGNDDYVKINKDNLAQWMKM